MKKLNFSNTKILMGVGIAGMLLSTVMAVKATPKAMRLIEIEKERSNVEKLPAGKIVKTSWRCYLPAAVTCAFSITLLTRAEHINLRKNAALATAYTMSETALSEYQKKVIDTIGEKKELLVRDDIAKDKLDACPVETSKIIVTGNGETLCFDATSGRYFKSGIESLRKVENILNKRLMDEMYISLNEFYYELGIPGLEPIDVGDDIGWNIDDGLITMHFSSKLTTDGTPCVVLSYTIGPRWDFTK